MIAVRPLTTADAPALCAAYLANWSFLAAWEPARDERFLTVEGQRDRLRQAEDERGAGRGYACVIELDAALAGTITLSAITRGPAQSAHLGYWVAQEVNGRGVATEAVRQILAVAFDELGLHRVEAATLLHNAGSQKVLARNGFERIGQARSYLQIDGRWQDHILFQRVADVA